MKAKIILRLAVILCWAWASGAAGQKTLSALRGDVRYVEGEGVKEAAVFAIGQLPGEEAVPMLIDIAKTNKSPKIRKQAMFWLGQTGDERALKFFEEILLKN